MKFKHAFIVVLTLMCAGCITDGYYYQRDPGFRYFPNEAVMLLGVVGKYDFNVVRGRTGEGGNYSLVIHPQDHEQEIVDVYAVAFRAGDSVAISRIDFEPLSGSNAVSVKYPYLDIATPKLVSFEPGDIVYYGTVVSSDKGVGFTDKYKDQMMALALKKYPSLFNGVKPKEVYFD